ncbi:MAG: hypothetical protein QHH30_09510 [candidate division NC10 bacterium]|nr:hypothetical protein [candidate division NC10 bacterium]
MKLHSDLRGFLQAARQRLSLSLKGFIVVISFSDSGRIRKVSLPKRLLFSIAVISILLLLFSTFVFFKHLDFLHRNARLAYLEEENSSLTARLQAQIEQINQLKKEIAELKDFEANLRAISGLTPSAQPVVGTGDGGERPASLVSKIKKKED